MEQPTAAITSEDPYDLMMGYYIVMGGFAMRQSNYISGEDDYEHGLHRTLTADYIQELAINGVFLRVDPENIERMSKDGILAKFYVCLEVFWMLVEVCRTIISYL
jgi:hypothetical protein